MRLGLSAAIVLMSIAGIAAADDARAAMRRTVSIPAQPLEQALRAFAKDSEYQFIYKTEVVGQRASQGAVGELTTAEALTRILTGTGLTFQFLDDHTVTILASGGAAVSQRVESISSSGELMQVAQAAGGAASASEPNRTSLAENKASAPSSEAEQAGKVEEIVVTAQKRTERLQDVPVPVTAVQVDSLVETNQIRMQDYYTKIPGLSLTLLGDTAAPVLTIRGITTGGYTNPTVGIVVDDIAFGTSTTVGGGTQAPDFDPSDLQRIEVLRGPQGTLYGASSLGGLLKYVTADPTTDRVSGRVQLGTAGVKNGDGLGYNVRAGVNLPVSDRFAIRASGFYRREPGYIDNPFTGEEGLNERRSNGGRLSALWQPSGALKVKLSALYQDNSRDGEDAVYLQPGL